MELVSISLHGPFFRLVITFFHFFLKRPQNHFRNSSIHLSIGKVLLLNSPYLLSTMGNCVVFSSIEQSNRLKSRMILKIRTVTRVNEIKFDDTLTKYSRMD